MTIFEIALYTLRLLIGASIGAFTFLCGLAIIKGIIEGLIKAITNG